MRFEGRDSNWAPCWHPDGKTIVFASNREAGRGQFSLWAVGADGKNLRRLTPTGHFDSFPHFSPNGKKLVFVSDRKAKSRRDLNVFLADWDH